MMFQIKWNRECDAQGQKKGANGMDKMVSSGIIPHILCYHRS